LKLSTECLSVNEYKKTGDLIPRFYISRILLYGLTSIIVPLQVGQVLVMAGYCCLQAVVSEGLQAIEFMQPLESILEQLPAA